MEFSALCDNFFDGFKIRLDDSIDIRKNNVLNESKMRWMYYDKTAIVEYIRLCMCLLEILPKCVYKYYPSFSVAID